MPYWTIMDFADVSGESLIRPWLMELAPDPRAAIQTFILFVATMEQLKRPQTAMLEGECDGRCPAGC